MMEERMDRLEKVVLQHAERMNGLQDAMIELLKGQGELAELRRNTQHNQRMWVHLSHKHGWLDDDDLGPVVR